MDGRGGFRPRKKLKDAAAYWAGGGKSDEKAREDLRRFGADEASIEVALGPKEEGFKVWPENWPALQAFLAVQTQWASGMGGATGLDYMRVRAGLEMAGIEVTPELFQSLRLMESAALEVFARLNEERAKEAKRAATGRARGPRA